MSACNNSVNRDPGYAPPKSKGPGVKKYTITVYALSAAPKITAAPEEVSRDVLLAALKDSILASAELNVVYTRDFGTGAASKEAGLPPQRPDPDRGEPPREPRERPRRRPHFTRRQPNGSVGPDRRPSLS